MRQTNTQCWIQIKGLPQEYWRPKILFAIARGVGVPLSLDDATINKTLGQFARVLVDIDLIKLVQEQIMVEREGFTLLVDIEYGYLPSVCPACVIIGHSISDCKKMQNQSKEVPMNDKFGAKKIV